MNIDQRIKQELENDAQEIDQILAQDPGLFSMIGNSFKGGMKRWVILINIVTFIATMFLFWSGYRFFIADQTNALIFWGVILLVLTNVQISLKMWLFMEVNRTSIMREIKRVELMLSRVDKSE